MNWCSCASVVIFSNSVVINSLSSFSVPFLSSFSDPRRFDTRTRFSEGGRPESASRRVDGRWSASRGVNSSNPHVLCASHRRMVEQQELRAQECWELWWHRGSAQLASCMQGMQPVGDGQARSSVMAALIDQADAKRRCVEVPSP